jgi:hypothetical protein
MLTPEEQGKFDAIVEGEQQRDPFYRAGRAAGMVLVPLVGVVAALLIVLLILMCAGLFS